MPKLRKVSGHKLLKVLCNEFGFKSIRQRGSHVVITKESPSGKIGTVVPMHNELKIGTLKAILKQAKVSEEEIEKFL